MTENLKPRMLSEMRTFSYMSTPDKVLTRQSYLRNLVFLNQMISTDSFLPQEQVSKLQEEVHRLKILIDAIDVELLYER